MPINPTVNPLVLGERNRAFKLTCVGAQKMYSAAIDYLLSRKDVDGKRLAVIGASWGGCWGAILGFTEKDRIRSRGVGRPSAQLLPARLADQGRSLTIYILPEDEN